VAVFTWLTKTAAVNALAARLNNSSLWTAAELWIMLTEGLRHFNALTEQWNQTFSVNNANGAWINTATLTGSPRLRSVTDQYLYNQMAYMLMESPLGGGAWVGTSQFNLGQLQQALQVRTQEVIQAASCNIAQLSPISATPGVRAGYALGDTVLEPRRNRFLALMAQTTATASSGASSLTVASAVGIVKGQVISGASLQAGMFATSVSGTAVGISLPTTGALSGTAIQAFQPFLLTREDVLSFQSFNPNYLQEVGYPMSWAVASEPPLSFDVDIAPTTPGNFDMLALDSGPTFAPPAATLLGVPDDWSMLPMYGALADVLGQEAECTDRARSAYCLQRYTMMLEMMKGSNWLLQSRLNGATATTEALADMDCLAVNWQQSQNNLPMVVEAGMDFIAPIPGVSQLLTLQLVGNAPLLDGTNTYVQVSRDDWDAVLNYAHHVSSFKLGNDEFQATVPMLKAFYQYCAQRNSRWAQYGVFVRALRGEGEKQERSEPKWSTKEMQ
jgi:hypothetical protein